MALVEQTPQIVSVEIGVAQDTGESAATKLSMQRDDERVPLPRLLQADVAAALTHDFPALLAKRLD